MVRPFSQIQKAVQLLNKNEIVAFPTETVYGLGARIDSEQALKKIFSTKERPFFDPLIVHVSSEEQAKSCAAEWSELVHYLAVSFWPGPLTLVVPKAKSISDLITSGLETVGVRWPKHYLAQELIRSVGVPLAAPSANKFGRTSPTSADHVRDEFKDSIYIMEDDAGEVGIESTVLYVGRDLNNYSLCVLRKGAILKSDIEKALSRVNFSYIWEDKVDPKHSPGHMKHHYMPSVPLVICKDTKMKLSVLSTTLNEKLMNIPDEIESVKIIKPVGEIRKIEFLKLPDTPEQAARELYSQLRSVSQRKPDAICFIQMPYHSGNEMWESVLDRLYKAATLILD